MERHFQGILLAVLIGSLCRQSVATTVSEMDAIADSLNKDTKCTTCLSDYDAFHAFTTIQDRCSAKPEVAKCVLTQQDCKLLPDALRLDEICRLEEMNKIADSLNKATECNTCIKDYSAFQALATIKERCDAQPEVAKCVLTQQQCKLLPEALRLDEICRLEEMNKTAESLNKDADCKTCIKDYSSFQALATIEERCDANPEIAKCVLKENNCKLLHGAQRLDEICRLEEMNKFADTLNKATECKNCTYDYSSFQALATIEERCDSATGFTKCVLKEQNCKLLPDAQGLNKTCLSEMNAIAGFLNKTAECKHCINDYGSFQGLTTIQERCNAKAGFAKCVLTDKDCKQLPEALRLDKICHITGLPGMGSLHGASTILLLLAVFVTFQG